MGGKPRLVARTVMDFSFCGSRRADVADGEKGARARRPAGDRRLAKRPTGTPPKDVCAEGRSPGFAVHRFPPGLPGAEAPVTLLAGNSPLTVAGAAPVLPRGAPDSLLAAGQRGRQNLRR